MKKGNDKIVKLKLHSFYNSHLFSYLIYLSIRGALSEYQRPLTVLLWIEFYCGQMNQLSPKDSAKEG